MKRDVAAGEHRKADRAGYLEKCGKIWMAAATFMNVLGIHKQAYDCVDDAAGARQRLLSNSNPYALCASISCLAQSDPKRS